MKKCVNDDTRNFMEEQFADCMTFEDVTFLYSDFEKIINELMKARHEDLIEGIQGTWHIDNCSSGDDSRRK